MASLTQQLQRCLLARTDTNYFGTNKNSSRKQIILRDRSRSSLNCSAIAIESQSSLAGVAGIRWGITKLQGAREEMEDDALIVQPDAFGGFSFAAVFDGHAGFSTVKFLSKFWMRRSHGETRGIKSLINSSVIQSDYGHTYQKTGVVDSIGLTRVIPSRDELYKECVAALQGGFLLSGKDFRAIKSAVIEAFENVDSRLLNLLETKEDDESGATATAMFIGDDRAYIAHVGDSSVVLSRSGKAEILTDPHRPYGNNKASLQEIRRVREAGGWISNGRICGDIAVSRAFGDIRFKRKKNEMLEEGVKEGRWTQKFVSRVKFSDDLVVACPDIYQVTLASDAEFVLLASDGLWDYINSSEAVSFVRNQLRQHGNVQLACESLATTALDRRSQDNISIIIADFGKTDWKRQQVKRENVLYEFGQAFATVGFVSLGLWLSSQLVL